MKGQWFLISAVVISIFFVTISNLLRDYFTADFVPVASVNEDFYFESVKDGIIDTVLMSPPSCTEIERNLTEFIGFSTRKMAKLGYLEQVTYISVNCAAKRYRVTLTLNSNRFKKTETFLTS